MKKSELELKLESHNLLHVFDDVTESLYINRIRFKVSKFKEMLDDLINSSVCAGNQHMELIDLRKAKKLIK